MDIKLLGVALLKEERERERREREGEREKGRKAISISSLATHQCRLRRIYLNHCYLAEGVPEELERLKKVYGDLTITNRGLPKAHPGLVSRVW